jgi:hypothetical protein
VCIGIISACLPCFRPFIRVVKQSWDSITGRSKLGKSSGASSGISGNRSSRKHAGDSVDAGDSLVEPRHRWDTLPHDGHSIGIKNEIRSDTANRRSSDLERGVHPDGIELKHDVYMTSKPI